MAEFSLLIKPSAAKEIEAAGSKKDRQRIVARIARIATDPRGPTSQKLVGDQERYRVRVGDYRIVYSIDDRAQTVEIVKVGHRREVYRAR